MDTKVDKTKHNSNEKVVPKDKRKTGSSRGELAVDVHIGSSIYKTCLIKTKHNKMKKK